MELAFYSAAVVAVLATVGVVTGKNPVHALLYLIVSLLSVSMIFFTIGAPFAAVLEVIVYAGAIMVLFVFVVMMLNLGSQVEQQEKLWLTPGVWLGPGVLSMLLLGLLSFSMAFNGRHPIGSVTVDAKQVGIALYGPYLLAVELASLLLLAALVVAYHIGRHDERE